MIKIYTTPKCQHCSELKSILKSRNIPYEEIDLSIGGNPDTIEIKQKFKKIGIKKYPILIGNDRDGNEIILSDWNIKDIEELLDDEIRR